MVITRQENHPQSGTGEVDEHAGPKAGLDKDNACRCKEASALSARQLFKLMISDLSFWKKAKKE